ncbi:DUF397 domain-containing protein [Spirillospora sp. NPDC048819]|uniref:DUF397 domain-containing protein n=1 Tax=Spirillospora sp. NPDC048819 TaxID=3155268 RepID=UPI0033EFD5F9
MSAAVWKKASRSNESGDACIELASNGEIVAIRDSKDPGGPKVLVSSGEFRRLAEMLKDL